MLDAATVFAIVGTFLIAGTCKGVIGLGLPTVSLALLTVAIDLPSAMALLLVPSFVTNLWQAMLGGNGRVILIRLWPFLLTATVTVWIGATALTRVDLSLLSALLGALLVAYSTVNLGGLRFSIETRHEVWVGPLAGSANGILAGMTGSFVVPGVMFLQAIGLSRDALIQAMGMLFTVSTLALAFGLQQNDFLTVEHGTLSLLALLPAIVGMVFGQRIRQSLSEQLFRKVFFISLLALGAYIITSAFDGFK
ncbi:MAG: sulfite exporter TauE/SafE family protein [Deltaproteobacteria bacterium]|nr:MAG: sulfite exporter TauE/SafE family protein [Deltaproteobacteria bacterium]